MARKRPKKWSLEIRAEANGRLQKPTILVRGEGDKLLFSDETSLGSAVQRDKAASRIAERLKIPASRVRPELEAAWNDLVDQQENRQQPSVPATEVAIPEATAELLDKQPHEIRRPLSLLGDHAFTAAWCKVRTTTTRSVNPKTAEVTDHNPPVIRIQERLVIVTDEGRLYADGDGVPGALPFAELGLPVQLPTTIPPGRGWSGAGVKRYVAGDRPAPAEVFARVVAVVDRFIDFDRSLAPQSIMCELIACAILATYFLEAFNVVGYLWPNGESGAGKTTFLHVVTDLAYLGQLILAGSTYPTLRDMADYGATLGFDDAEAVMDVKRSDPDKRTLLLAGNRRGATIAVKEWQGERWVTRHVNTFCFRLFSAIRLPDAVLGSRSIIVPLVRSGDPERTKANPADETLWPCDRQRLLDDLWALGLKNLPMLRHYDAEAARLARLSGRNLEPWRAILAVARWLEDQHGVAGLFDRLERLSVDYQAERNDYEEHDPTRILLRVLLGMLRGRVSDEKVTVRPKDIATEMNAIATAEGLAEPDKEFTNTRKVGWLLKRHRFQRPKGSGRDERGKQWEVTRQAVEAAARAHGMEIPDETPLGDTPRTPTEF
jgi:hypothetical protein